jgi:hypothetical protein
MNLTEIVVSLWFWLCVVGILYVYLVYPIVIYILSRVFGKAPSPPHMPDEELPHVALLIFRMRLPCSIQATGLKS